MKVASLLGQIEYSDHRIVKGWAADTAAPDRPAAVEVWDGGTPLATLTPSLYRWDHGRADGFVYALSPGLLDGGPHSLRFRFSATGDDLEGSPVPIRHLYEADYVPYHTSRLTGPRVLVLAPHPDDESLACGGTLALHRRRGEPVKVVVLSDGAHGHQGRARTRYAQEREAEARRACETLGVADVEFWRVPDRGLGDAAGLVPRLVDVLASYRPDLIYAPSPIEAHPDHRTVAHLVWAAVGQARAAARVAFYELSQPLRVNTLVAIDRVLDQKRRACRAYASQLDVHPYDECALGLNRYRALTVSRECRHAEGFLVLDASIVASQPIEAATVRQAPRRMADAPLVSVIVRTRDRPRLLRDALSSLLTQTYPSLEAIVVNDGGTPVEAIVDEVRPYLPVTPIVHPAPRGRSAAANSGLAAARGKYVTFLDDDDLLYADHLDKLVRYMEATGCEAAYSDCVTGHYGMEGGAPVLLAPREPFLGMDFDRDWLYFENYLAIMVVVVSRRLAERVGPFDEALEAYEDWDYWIRAAGHATFTRLPGVTAEYRRFGSPAFDGARARSLIYDKYRDHWNTRALLARTVRRVEALREENTALGVALRTAQEAGVVGSVRSRWIAWARRRGSPAWRVARRLLERRRRAPG
jgi:LmbE family N-acetylglucosaminyl deacetylase/glycosyltransferase involved in cell wall biosynthesis